MYDIQSCGYTHVRLCATSTAKRNKQIWVERFELINSGNVESRVRQNQKPGKLTIATMLSWRAKLNSSKRGAEDLVAKHK